MKLSDLETHLAELSAMYKREGELRAKLARVDQITAAAAMIRGGRIEIPRGTEHITIADMFVDAFDHDDDRVEAIAYALPTLTTRRAPFTLEDSLLYAATFLLGAFVAALAHDAGGALTCLGLAVFAASLRPTRRSPLGKILGAYPTAIARATIQAGQRRYDP
jgi:hypothetical protein